MVPANWFIPYCTPREEEKTAAHTENRDRQTSAHKDKDKTDTSSQRSIVCLCENACGSTRR